MSQLRFEWETIAVLPVSGVRRRTAARRTPDTGTQGSRDRHLTREIAG